MSVLLEEQPSQRLRTLPRVAVEVRSPIGQPAQDRVGFGKEAAILAFDDRHPAVGVLRQELRRAGLALRTVDLDPAVVSAELFEQQADLVAVAGGRKPVGRDHAGAPARRATHSARVWPQTRSEEHTSELQSLMRISYAVFCLK